MTCICTEKEYLLTTTKTKNFTMSQEYNFYSQWSQTRFSIHPSLNIHLLSVTPASLLASASALLKEINNRVMASTLRAIKRQGTNRPVERELVSRVWLYFAVQKSSGAILRQTSLKKRLCQVNTALQLGPLKKLLHTITSFYIYLLYDRFLSLLLSSIRLNTTHRLPPKWLLKSGAQNFRPT